MFIDLKDTTTICFMAIAVLAAVCISVYILFFRSRQPVIANTPARKLSTEEETEAKKLVTRLRRHKTVLYGADYCGPTRQQKQLLGSSISRIRYVNCEKGEVCKTEKIRAFPTWVIDGTHHIGLKSVSQLNAILDAADEAKTAATQESSKKAEEAKAADEETKTESKPAGELETASTNGMMPV